MFLFVYCLFGVLYFFYFRLIINRYINFYSGGPGQFVLNSLLRNEVHALGGSDEVGPDTFTFATHSKA